MSQNEDILQIIPTEDIAKLRDLYKERFPCMVYIYNFLNSAINWKSRCPGENYIKVMAPHGNWRNGTFIAAFECHEYEVFMCTLEENCEILYEMIVKTKKVDWNKRMLVYAIHEDHIATVLKALNKTNFSLLREMPCNIWWMPCNKALQLKVDCAPELQIKKLDKTHAEIINSYWPHTFPGSEHYIALMIEMNGGYGLFLKSTNQLIAWILRIQIGLGTLHVLDEHKRKGYGALVTKYMSKEMAKEGLNPLAGVLTTNEAAGSMFEKIGFEKSELVIYLESRENTL